MLKGKTALVTGSTSGIGLGIAKRFAADGANIVLNGFGSESEIETLRSGLEREHQVSVRYDGADMSDPAAIEAMMRKALDQFGTIDVLVNNAGIQHVAPIDEFPPEKWNAIIAINLVSAFHTIRHALPRMKQRKWGRIINVASAHALVASPFKSAYVASKHGILGFTKTVALEVAEAGIVSFTRSFASYLGPQGIQVNAVAPGPIDTELLKNAQPERVAHLMRAVYTKRVGRPQEVAEAIRWLALDAPEILNGAVIDVTDGCFLR